MAFNGKTDPDDEQNADQWDNSEQDNGQHHFAGDFFAAALLFLEFAHHLHVVFFPVVFRLRCCGGVDEQQQQQETVAGELMGASFEVEHH